MATTIETAKAYMERYDVLSTVGTSEMITGAGADGKVDGSEMNRAAPALALQALPDEEFAKVWSTMSDSAKRQYFFLVYPALEKFRESHYSGMHVDMLRASYFGGEHLTTDDDKRELLRAITNRRDLTYFLQVPKWIDRDYSGDDFGTEHFFGGRKDKATDEALRSVARRLISGGPVSPNGPALVPPR